MRYVVLERGTRGGDFPSSDLSTPASFATWLTLSQEGVWRGPGWPYKTHHSKWCLLVHLLLWPTHEWVKYKPTQTWRWSSSGQALTWRVALFASQGTVSFCYLSYVLYELACTCESSNVSISQFQWLAWEHGIYKTRWRSIEMTPFSNCLAETCKYHHFWLDVL